MNLINTIIDALFIVLCVTCFGTIIWYNVTEISEARRQLRQQHRTFDESASIRVNRWPVLVGLLTLAFTGALPAQSPFLRDDSDDPEYSDAYRQRLRAMRERVEQQRQDLQEEQAREQAEEEARSQSERLFPKKDDDLSAIDSRPTRKVYGVDNRGDRELYPELIIEPSIYDRYEVYETDSDGLKKWESKAIIKQGVYDRYEVYKTDRDGLVSNEPSLIIEEGLHGDQKIYKTDRYGMPEDIPSRVIKTDALGRQEIYNTDRYGIPIGDPIDEKILE